jgi:hypothetical protein
LTVTQPSGWKLERESIIREGISFAAEGAKLKRIATYSLWNPEQAPLSESLADQWIQTFCARADFEADPLCKPSTLGEVHGFQVVETVFVGPQAVRQETSPGAQQDAAKATDDTLYKFRLLVYGSADRFRINLLQTANDAQEFSATNQKVFDKYLRDFQMNN